MLEFLDLQQALISKKDDTNIEDSFKDLLQDLK